MYIPLKVTTDYSLLKSLIKVPDLIDFLVSNNISACGICDDNLGSSIEFYKLCKKNNIKPIIGLSVYLNELELYLYAKNYDGYKNLIKLNTIKEKRDIAIIDINTYIDNLIIVIPYKSIDLYGIVNGTNVYLSYTNEYEYQSIKILSDNIIYINDIRALNVSDIKYLDFLNKLSGEEIKDNSNLYYHDDDIIDNDALKKFVSMIDIEIPFNNRYIPKYKDGLDSYKYLYNLCFKGLEKRLGSISKIYSDRLNYELDIINKMGFVDYFLIVYDYVLYAKKNGIMVGPGRGSAAGSLVSFSIGITDVDPIKYDLMFERFLNPSRVTMPDIDIDFDAERREEVIEYVRNRYGTQNVALGLTYNTYKAKLVLRDVAKILNIDNSLVDKFIKCIDAKKDLKDNLSNKVVKNYLNNYSELKTLYDISMHLEGLKKNTSTHAAGVVISSVVLDDIIPVHFDGDTLITGITMEYLEELGLLKMDFLALKNLTTISNIIKSIGKNVLKNINFEDKRVYNLFASGKTDGIFQFETPLLKNLCIKLKPTCFNDLVALIALGRPGPMQYVDEYIRRKNGGEFNYIHEDLEEILKSTYGIIIYQEQIIEILKKIGGYTATDADMIRRAISKKKDDVLKKEGANFIRKSIETGYSREVAENIYNLIVRFASYGFNKSHSVAYSIISYQMAYLKVYYTEYFIQELLNNKDSKSLMYLNYLKSKNIKFIKPNVNNITDKYIINNNELLLPFTLIKGITSNIANKIKDNGAFLDIFDFYEKCSAFITDDVYTTLVKAGALDVFGLNKRTLIENLAVLKNYADIYIEGIVDKPSIVEYEEYDKDTLRKYELETYGFYISNHPSSKYNTFKLINVENNLFKRIKCIVLVEDIKKIKTKKGEDMAFMRCSDETAEFDFTVFPKVMDKINNININNLVEINGNITKRFDKISIIVDNIKRVE